MVAAQLLFDAEDKLWYLLSDEAMRQESRMRLKQHGQARLLEAPVLRWSSVSPMPPLAGGDEPSCAGSAIRAVFCIGGRWAGEVGTDSHDKGRGPW